MSKFEYMEFGYDSGSADMVVFHAKKYTKEQCIETFNSEYAYKGKKATIEDMEEGYVKYFINPPYCMSGDFEGGCYGFTDRTGNGAFPVYVLEFGKLQEVDK